MAERRTRRRLTAEVEAEAEAVERLLDGGKGLGEVATELGLSPGQLSGWRNEHLAAGSAEPLAQREAERAELQGSRRENCLDNAPAESSFASLEKGRVHRPRRLPHPCGGEGGRARVRRDRRRSAAVAPGLGLPHPGRGAGPHGRDHHARGRVRL